MYRVIGIILTPHPKTSKMENSRFLLVKQSKKVVKYKDDNVSGEEVGR